jgi:hypothetical protein
VRGRALRPGPLLLVAVLAAGCAADAGDSDGEDFRALERAPDEAFFEAENALLRAGGSRIEFDVTSEGAFEAELAGFLHVLQGNELELEADGRFGGESVELRLRTRDERMRWGNADGVSEDEIPDELMEAVLVGLARMGVLHNLARLVAGAPPDRAGGGVREWVQVEDFEWADGRSGAGTGERGVAFRIRVAGQPAGRATVWLDASGAMTGRDQVVEFPGGEMRVRERYRPGR